MLTFAQAVAADSAMIYSAEFSEPVTIINGNQTVSVNALVDLTHIEVNMNGSDIAVETVKPRVELWAPGVPWALRSDAGQIVVVRGIRYIIRHVNAQGDLDAAGTGEGSVILTINRAKQ